jgi:hypothetical protein
MAVAMTATTVIGFGLNAVMGRSSFGAPWWVHVHGVTMMLWMGLYLFQNWQVYRGNLRQHRTLGWIATFYIGWMVLVGAVLTPVSIAAHRNPPFFDAGQFLALDWLNIIGFAGLSWAAVVMRKRTDWHRRLMFVGTLSIMGPAWGRLLPMPLMGAWKLWVLLAVLLIYLAVAMRHDMKHRGAIHPAYRWGLAILVLQIALIDPIGYSPPFLALAKSLIG